MIYATRINSRANKLHMQNAVCILRSQANPGREKLNINNLHFRQYAIDTRHCLSFLSQVCLSTETPPGSGITQLPQLDSPRVQSQMFPLSRWNNVVVLCGESSM